MANLAASPPADKPKAFAALCWANAYLWSIGEINRDDAWIGHAVDPLQAWAERHGLIEAIGQDEIQRIMADAFARFRRNDDV